jgi:streptogramin lyase/two-component sensor histidine kinase
MRDGKNGGRVGVQQIYEETGGEVAEGPDGALWAGSGFGIKRMLLDSRPAMFQVLTRANGLIDRKVTALARDRAGNMWAGTEAGVMKIQPEGFTTFREADGLASDWVVSALANRAGTVLAVTGSEVAPEDHPVNTFDGVRFHAMSVKGYSERPPWGTHGTVLQARTGAWWAATGRGFCQYAPGRTEALAGKPPETCYAQDTSVFQIFEDSKGRIWASAQVPPSDAPRLMRWDPATKAISRFDDGQVPPGLVSAFAEGRDGNIWMGLWTGGLLRYDGRQFTRFQQADGVPAGAINELLIDSGGRLWIASLNGLGIIDNSGSPHFGVRVYKTSDGLASDAINCIIEDTAGRIYAGTTKGVDRLDPRTGRIKHFSTADGLAHGEVKVAVRDRSGDLWFGTTQGFSRLFPAAGRPPAIPTVRIMDLRVGRERYPVSQVGETRIPRGDLQPYQNQFQVSFVGFSDEPEANLRYTYMLEGGDTGWQGPGREHEANYPELAPGPYRFLVKAVNSEGQPSTTPAEIDFVILPPVWGRWWFRLLGLLACGALLYGAYRYNLNRLLELERVRARIAADLHDDIGSSLSGMAFLSEAVKQQIGTARPEAFEMASEVAVMARGLARALSDVVWSIDPRRDDLRNVIMRIRQSAAALEAQGIAWSLQGPPQPQKVKLTPQQRHHLYLIFKEALNNIARHAHCASARLTITVEDRRLRAEIVDDGCGFSQAGEPGSDQKEQEGNGLRNMKLRAEQLGGRLRVDAAARRGVRLELTLPLK